MVAIDESEKENGNHSVWKEIVRDLIGNGQLGHWRSEHWKSVTARNVQ